MTVTVRCEAKGRNVLSSGMIFCDTALELGEKLRGIGCEEKVHLAESGRYHVTLDQETLQLFVATYKSVEVINA